MMADYGAMRAKMIDGQVLPNRIVDRNLLMAMSEVPRERFVGADQKAFAYSDKNIEIGQGRYLIEPRVFAGMVEGLSPGSDDMVLDIGCGSGYGIVILAKLCNTVVGIDCDEVLLESASALLNSLEVDNAVTTLGPLNNGYPNEAPYDLILMEGSVPCVPQVILNQLVDGGRLAVVIRRGPGLYEANLVTRIGENFGRRILFNGAAPELPGFDRMRGFAL